MADIEIVEGHVPGAIGRVAELHGSYYHSHWGFGLEFEAKVARELAGFLERFDAARDGFWAAIVDGRVEGSISIDGLRAAGEGAHLRWFIVAPSLAGSGLGTRLLRAAIDLCRLRGYARVYLWTFEGLSAARHLYESNGFRLMEQRRGAQWGSEVNEQRFELDLR
jgi:GNAT superfamily N-acetyltransferase